MACFVELKFKDNTTDIAGGERIFLLPVIDKDVNLTVDDIVDLIMENGDEELKSFIPQLKSRYDTIDAIMERGKINVSSISSINSSIDASFIRSYISSPTVGGLLDFCMSKLNIGNNIHIANAEIVNWDGKACDGVLIRQGSLKKIQIDSKVNVTSDSFGSIVSDANFQNILGHELMHYIADDKLEELDVNSIEYKTIDSIYNKFKEEYRKKDSDLESNINKIISEVDSYEGVRKLQEFLANAVGDNEVRTEMSNMKPIERTKENKTLLDSFVNWLSKLVFGENIEPSLMSDLLSVTSGLFDMNKSFFGKDKKNSIVLNNEQKDVVNKAVEFIKNGDPSEFFTIEGKAGTGKTTIAERIVNEFPNKRVYVASLSNKAKNVIKDKFLKSGVDAEFYSLAGLLGQKLDLETGIFNRDKKENDEIPIEIADLILIDESSMVNEQALEMIFQFKKKEAKVLFLGDIGQLPPIRTLKNPYYMDKQYLFEKKSPTFNTKNKGSLLTRVRQGEASPILPFADLFWENSQVERPLDNPAPISSRSNIVTENGALLFTNSFSKIKDSVLDSFKKAIESNNPNHIKVVTYKNDTRRDINSFIHKSIFGVNSPEFNPGELLIFNDHFHRKSKPIENSTEVQIRNINRTYTDGDFLNITEIDFLLDNAITTIPIISSDSKQRYKELISMKFYEAFALKGTDKESYLRALRSAWDFKKKYADVDYAYAITSHKSQGSTYDIVVVDEKDINSVGAISAKTKSESIYTALTRSRNVSIVISSLKVDDVDINTEDLNSNINKLKNNERNIGLSQPQQQSTEIAKTEKESLIYSNYINISEYTNHSGGAIGSDSEWDNIGRKYGMVNNMHYWTESKTPKGNVEISNEDFEEGKIESAKAANRNFGYKYQTMKDSRLIRNWAQVKYSDAIFAIGNIVRKGEKISPKQSNDTRVAVNPSVTGGTGYAVGMAIINNKPVYVFNQSKGAYEIGWYKWDSNSNDFIKVSTPALTKNFAGIGTREINESGKNAIREVYEKTLNKIDSNLERQPQHITASKKLNVSLINENYPYTKTTATENPNVNFIFTENAEAYVRSTFYGQEYTTEFPNMYGTKLNVTATNNQAGIRTDKNGNINKNAIGIVVKKYQQNKDGKFISQEGTFKDTDSDFNMFVDLNNHAFKRLLEGNNEIVVPKQFALGKAALPLRFAEWLKNEFESKLRIVSNIKENQNDSYNGYGLEVTSIKPQQQHAEEKTINIYAGTGENSDLSNFAYRPFKFESPLTGTLVTYNTVEGAFQAAKLGYTNLSSQEIAEIETRLMSASGDQAKSIGRSIKGLDIKEWDKNSSSIMEKLLKSSFRQNQKALEILLSTGDAILTHTQDKSKWGKEFPRLLMEVRNELSNQQQLKKTPTIEGESVDDIYNKLGDRTVSDNIEIIPWDELMDLKTPIVKTARKMFDELDLELKKGSVVLYNNNKYLFWNNNNGKAQLINTDGTKFSGTPNIDKLKILGNYKTTIYNNVEYIVTDNDNIYSGATGKIVYDGNDGSSKAQKNKIITKARFWIGEKPKIIATRIKNSNEHFGNPFSHDERIVSQNKNLIKVNSTKEAVERYIDWVVNSQEERAKWIRNKIKYGNLKGLPIVYYKELGEPSHATALDYLINKYDWSNDEKSADDTTGVKSYNEAENATKDDQLQISFSKEMSLKSSPENNMSQLSYFSTLLEEKYGVKINLMNSSQIAKELDTSDSTYSRHRAFILDNQIYINVDKASVAEPLHEMGHIVLSALKYSDYDLYEVLLHSIQSHPSYDMIAKHYNELEGVSLDEEVFVTVFGEHYRKVARSEQEVAWHNSHESLFDRIVESIKNFFSNLFGVNIELPAEQFIKLPMEEVLTKFGDMLVKGRFADVNVNVLMSKELEGLKRKLINEGILTQMC